MSPLLQLLLLLSLVVFLAKLAGWASSRLGQPAVLGELLVGLLLGPSLLNLLNWPALGSASAADTIDHLAEIGVILLMLIAGLEVDLRDLRRAGRSALFSGTLGVVVSLAAGWGLTRLFGYDSPAAFAVGVLIIATSVSISAQTLMELNILATREGIALLGAGVVDDILAILILSVETAFRSGSGGGGLGAILLIVGRMALFLGVGGFLCLWGLPRLMRRVERWPLSAAVASTVLVVTFFVAWAADYLGGLATVTGAFLVGLGLRRSTLHRTISDAVRTMGYALFVPLFFVSVGLHADARAVDARLLLFAGLLILVAIVSKALANGLGAWLGGFPPAAALRVGLGMIPRGEVSLIAAAVEIREGWIGPGLFAVVVLMVLITTLITPLLLKAVFRGKETKPAPQES